MQLGKPFAVLILLVVACVDQPSFAQTLNEKLVEEDLSKLAADARKTGDIVRGAILFHQGNINCAKCHQPASEKDRIGPDLSRLGTEATDAQIVESILQPSKVISKGFESTVVLTVQGQVVTGVLVSSDDQLIVLRSGQEIGPLITIARKEIAESKLSPKSSMPDGLVNELKNRQQFLDLLRYVFDVRDRGPQAENSVASSLVQGATRGRELSAELKGLVLIDKLNCVACHATEHMLLTSPSARAPDLKWSAKRLNPSYLAKFIADPQHVKPGTTMPRMLLQTTQQSQSEQPVAASATTSATAIVQYLISVAGSQYEPNMQIDREAIDRGYELFQTVGCVACHAPRDEQGVELVVEQAIENSAPLGNLVEKYDAKGLTAFLEDPHATRPSGRMPNMVLKHKEAEDLSSFLLQSTKRSNEPPAASWKADSTLVVQGKRLFTDSGCIKCHSGFDIEEAASASLKAPALTAVNLDKGCLSSVAGAWPQYQLAADEVQQIKAAVKQIGSDHDADKATGQAKITDSQQIDFVLAKFNCIACHSRENLGGVSDVRSAYFQTTNLNLGEQGRIPPTLTGVGAKLNAKWLRDVLVNHRSIRPYMKTRMPQFGEQNVGQLIALFEKTDQLAETTFAAVDDPQAIRKQGHTLVGNQGLNCVACHTYQFKLSDTMPAVDLTEMAERLKKDWFYQYMLAPQQFSPNTVMPSYWPNGRAIRADLPGDPKLQVESIWQYLLDGRQANAPQGVVREPLEIVVNDQTKMLRRSYPEIGKRGIGIGYRGGVNVAFDAEQMRLASLWKGKFVDPAGVWLGQGHGNVRSMGPTIQLSKGPELDDASKPWTVDDGRPPNHHFKGYVLDKAGRPTLRYRFDAVDVEDFCAEFTDEATSTVQLLRRVKMTANEARSGLRFRLAQDKEIQPKSGNEFVVGKRLTIRIVSEHSVKLVTSSEVMTLFVPLEFNRGQVDELKLEYRWE